VAYRLTAKEVNGDVKTKRNWKADPYLEDAETLEPPDYKGAHSMFHYDRGHLAPLGSFKGTDSWDETNYLSNIVPQKNDLNGGPWEKLESAIRRLTNIYEVVYAITGPVYSRKMPDLPNADESHIVPSGFYYIVCVETNEGISAVAFYFDQDTHKKNKPFDHLVTIDEIEKKTGLDFLRLLPDSLESEIESEINEDFALELLY